jgi:hypothetical protein
MIQSFIPPEVDEKYMALFHEVSHLHRKWGIFRHLYVSGNEIVDLLNAAGGEFFSIVQNLLADDIVLTITRLTDPKQSVGKNNLSLEQLIHAIDDTQHPRLRQDIEQIYATSRPRFSFAKRYRDKVIAHNDLPIKLARASSPPIPTTTNIEDALKGIRDVMNAVPKYFRNLEMATVNYYTLVTNPGDENRLIARLHSAQTREASRADISVAVAEA